ncbi:Bifunctional lysine-specific demethylase and histidyl-hydroxylase NO66 [Hondaea fermentalgiana]|uniref:Bifunctional lysine-specific demethylase and histidyl-hydroxylase n=1 Tax=Hondaea fermentalgiana TaxID=2315210 RepID=A0A2R5GRS2_9STRA|nr:Bifunctional lysine-specific demethylase and histidyl-hydroxylase NO66 [Hondaea fermentalgiana]|eukprot:GBG33295.1 Bifunctional lysine-specific demethylase and histidyl-hydroxylase NO66 [Hondaea fermentalgiana]
MDEAAQKRKRQARNRRRADKKRAKKVALYGKTPVARALEGEGSDEGASSGEEGRGGEQARASAGAEGRKKNKAAPSLAARLAARQQEEKAKAGKKKKKKTGKKHEHQGEEEEEEPNGLNPGTANGAKKKNKKKAGGKSAKSDDAAAPGTKEVEAICEAAGGDFRLAGERALQWILGGATTVEDFMSEYYETKPLLVRRNKTGQTTYFDGLLAKTDIEKALQAGKLQHNRDFSLTAYRDGARKTLMHDTEAVADAKEVMSLFGETQGASVRLLRPQELSKTIWKLVTLMEGLFGCGGGANAYLTPKGSQGFAPHYDDIDAFILQLEGAKEWTVYHHYESKKQDDDDDEEAEEEGEEDGKDDDDAEDDEEDEEDEDPDVLFPRNPRYSSKDFTEEQVAKHLKVAIHTTLEPGDVLYIPRGMVHHARSKLREHSLHVTLSVGQLNTWADFIREALPHAIQRTCMDDKALDCEPLRRNLPRELANFMGVVNSDQESDPRRHQFVAEMIRLISEHVLQNIDFDLIADRMGVKFQHDRHQPLGVLAVPQEASMAVESVADGRPATEDDIPEDELEQIDVDSQVVLAAKGVGTLTVEGNAALFYHSCLNTRTYHATDSRGLEFELEDAEMLEQILNSDPSTPLTVGKLKHPDSDEDKLRVVRFLVRERVLLMCD